MIQKPDIKTSVVLESRIIDFMTKTAFLIPSSSLQIFRDDDFFRIRDRKINDIHFFLKTKTEEYFHCKAYSRHMLRHLDIVEQDKIFLTGYLQENISKKGGKHSLVQKWYKMDPEHVSTEIVRQNKYLF